jgi:hypothetical protein
MRRAIIQETHKATFVRVARRRGCACLPVGSFRRCALQSLAARLMSQTSIAPIAVRDGEAAETQFREPFDVLFSSRRFEYGGGWTH